MQKNILISGGAGFIGSNLLRHLLQKYPSYNIICIDKLTYAGNTANLEDLFSYANFHFLQADICDFEKICSIFELYKIDSVIHLAAESHVDRSIEDPFIFARTNVLGTLSLLQASLQAWKTEGFEGKIFYHISTDEVYGALPLDAPEEKFRESDKYDPSSPYSASKASSDHFVRAFHRTYGLPVIVSNCSNNYGPYQYPEKLIPLCISRIVNREKIPVYGRGENVRDWLYVEDHAEAIDLIFHTGKVGETYNIGGSNELSNIDLVKKLISVCDSLLGRPEGEDLALISFVQDRPGHDLRYAIDSSKLQKELGWRPQIGFEQGLEKTVRWYLEHKNWLK